MLKLNKAQQAKYNEIIDQLKVNSIKITEIRSNIIKLIIVSEHINIQQLTLKLEKNLTNVNLASVYNTIDLLLKEHIIASNTFDGKNIWYELSTNKSAHIKCDECGNIEHVSADKITNINFDEFKDLILDKKQKLEHVKIELHVICESCTKKRN
ncbi:Fur family transcriptional regulator [Mesoplasma coleopterae]|uniref:Fur family transcriptional regulator n=1 Tax=Mesoplasma coleopterae TaxID=324078 RepID=A0A2K8P321_9MOLU|nr:transcriptional repressor [Mesoplasma coleopterae]ATZ21129.1 Fur family transcriptional regulator [Mesoplasma coleopterae]AVN62607.1 Fur family transcriptional regulator [Mesoplasma coleopterae]AVN63289.1 Fur family transcriptional regulator [Mesoplasma coleopterae]